jgi:probable HAF family extracellular repeat protein
MPHRQLRALLILGFVLSSLSAVQAASYTVTPIDVPNSRGTQARGINASGTIVGNYMSAESLGRAFLLIDGQFITFDFLEPNGFGTFPYGINNQGTVAGVNLEEGFIFSLTQVTSIDVPGSQITYVGGINNRGQVAGYYQDAQGVAHDFLWSKGQFTTIDPPGTSGIQVGLNDAGQVVGSYSDPTTGKARGFVYDKGVFTTIDAPNSLATEFFGINDAGQIVGAYQDTSAQQASHGFVLSKGVFTVLPGPGVSGPLSVASGINQQGQIVGWYTDPTTGITHGFLATPTGNP